MRLWEDIEQLSQLLGLVRIDLSDETVTTGLARIGDLDDSKTSNAPDSSVVVEVDKESRDVEFVVAILAVEDVYLQQLQLSDGCCIAQTTKSQPASPDLR